MFLLQTDKSKTLFCIKCFQQMQSTHTIKISEKIAEEEVQDVINNLKNILIDVQSVHEGNLNKIVKTYNFI